MLLKSGNRWTFKSDNSYGRIATTAKAKSKTTGNGVQ